ncbi:MAG TPA: AI-2E family transporter [Acidimicrobiia bacterium]|nr:AI-2E family transporter [Acidimicrobiia bacterium]
MATKKNESPEAGSSEDDLDLDDIGIELAHSTIDVDPRSLPMIVAGIVFCGLAYMLFTNIAQTMTALVIALLFALALDPVVRKVQYLSFGRFRGVTTSDDSEPVRRMGRYSAVSIVLGTFLIVVLLAGYFIAPKVVDQVQNFAKDIPETVRDLGKLPIVGEQLGSEQTQEKIKNTLEELPERLSASNSPLGDILRSVVNGAYIGFLFILMFIALLLDGPRLVRNIRRLIRPEQRDTADRIARATYRVIGKYMAGSILVASLAGLVIGTSALILGVPLAPLLGLWIVGTNLIPQVGGFLGGFPFVVFGFTVSPTVGIICLVVFIVYQQIENHIIQPIVIGKTVKISPPVTMVAALIGVAAGGVLGAMLAVPCVGGAKALAAEFDFPRGSREKALRDAEDNQDRNKKKLSFKRSPKKTAVSP